MNDIVLDTHILSLIISQYNSANEFAELSINNISQDLLKKINDVIKLKGTHGFIIASPIAFIELANQFNKICHPLNITLEKFKAFIVQPPTWFLIEPLNIDNLEFLSQVDIEVVKNGTLTPVEINDALHVITALARGIENVILGSKDGTINVLPIMQDRVLS